MSPHVASNYSEYGFTDARESHMHSRFLPHVFEFAAGLTPGMRVLDVGCGNGFTCGEFLKRGWKVVGIDLSEQGIAIARISHPQARFEVLPADNDLLANLGEVPFDLVVSTEVIEHVYAPKAYVAACFHALRPGGRFICTTPYHGYLKNLALSALNGWDTHANPLWDCGHIKLWSRATLSTLLTAAGFKSLRFRGAGRMPYLWMTMVICADKPKA